MTDQLSAIIATVANSPQGGLVVQAFAFVAYSTVVIEAIRSPRRISIYATALATAAFLWMIAWNF